MLCSMLKVLEGVKGKTMTFLTETKISTYDIALHFLFVHIYSRDTRRVMTRLTSRNDEKNTAFNNL